jgi:DNA-binding XRE family transcriptional regulator
MPHLTQAMSIRGGDQGDIDQTTRGSGASVMEPLERFGVNLRRLRDEAGLTQMTLSHRCGLEAAEISRLERGMRNPHLRTILRLAAALDVEPSELFRDLVWAR